MLLTVSQVTIDTKKYEELVRDSQTLNVIKNMVANNKYVSVEDIRTITSLNEEKGGNKNESV
jgi:hypothetical protein